MHGRHCSGTCGNKDRHSPQTVFGSMVNVDEHTTRPVSTPPWQSILTPSFDTKCTSSPSTPDVMWLSCIDSTDPSLSRHSSLASIVTPLSYDDFHRFVSVRWSGRNSQRVDAWQKLVYRRVEGGGRLRVGGRPRLGILWPRHTRPLVLAS